MTTRHRITTAAVVALGLAAGAGPAWAHPTDLTPSGSEVSAGSPSLTIQAITPSQSRPDKSMIPRSASTGGDFLAPAAPQAVVHVTAANSGFDWGDAGIGAGGGFAVSMIVVGGALVASQRRGRRAHGTAVTS